MIKREPLEYQTGASTFAFALSRSFICAHCYVLYLSIYGTGNTFICILAIQLQDLEVG
jgi:hypothetical protein